MDAGERGGMTTGSRAGPPICSRRRGPMEEPACDTAGASTGGFISYPMLPNGLLRYIKDSGWD